MNNPIFLKLILFVNMHTIACKPIEVPLQEKKVLLHSCCAPCFGEVIEAMVTSGPDLTIFFYNPNIHPKKEYELLQNENIRYAERIGIEFVDAEYALHNWFKHAKSLENEPERGIRCTMYFAMRLVHTALYAYENGF